MRRRAKRDVAPDNKPHRCTETEHFASRKNNRRRSRKQPARRDHKRNILTSSDREPSQCQRRLRPQPKRRDATSPRQAASNTTPPGQVPSVMRPFACHCHDMRHRSNVGPLKFRSRPRYASAANSGNRKRRVAMGSIAQTPPAPAAAPKPNGLRENKPSHNLGPEVMIRPAKLPCGR